MQPPFRSPHSTPPSRSGSHNVVPSLDQVTSDCTECRTKLIKLASLVERSMGVSSSASSTSPSATNSSQQQHQDSHHHQHHHQSSGGGGIMDSLAAFMSGDSSDDSNRNYKKEYLALAESCQAAAHFSEKEAKFLTDAVKRQTALKEAAERERDQMEDELIQLRKVADTLREQQFEAAKSSATHALLQAREDEKKRTLDSLFGDDQHQQQVVKSAATSSSPSTKNDENGMQQQQQQQDAKSFIHGTVNVAIGTAEHVLEMIHHHQDNTNSSQDSPCAECIELRHENFQLADTAKHQLATIHDELFSLRREFAAAQEKYRENLQRAIAAAQAKGEALVRRSAARFLIRSSSTDLSNSRKLVDAEMTSAENRFEIERVKEELVKLRGERTHELKIAEEKAKRSEIDNKELRSVIDRFATSSAAGASSHQSPSTSSSSGGPFMMWLGASSDNNSSPSSSPGIVEAARRLLNLKRITSSSSSSSSSSQFSVEDETVARALYMSHETLRETGEENQRLSRKVRQLEEQIQNATLQIEQLKKQHVSSVDP